MCNKYILFKENQNYSNFLPGKSHSIFLYLYVWLIFDLSGLPPSGNIGNILSILLSLRNLRNMRNVSQAWDVCILTIYVRIPRA